MAVLLKGVTADYLVHDLGHVRAGTRLLVHAAIATSSSTAAGSGTTHSSGTVRTEA